MDYAMITSAYSPTAYGKRNFQFPISQELPLDIAGSTTFGRYPKISASETFNMMISDNALVPFAGYEAVARIAKNAEAREIYTSTKYNHMFVVVDDGLYTVSPDLSVARINSLNTSSGEVYITENLGGQIGIADGESIYIFDYINNTFTIPTIDFLPGYISFQDTYFIASSRGTNEWRLSENDNGNSWPAAASNVGKFQTKPTNVVAVVPLDRQLFVFGQTGGEPWYDVGYTLFPYQRSNYASIDYGCLSPATIATGFSKLVWLGTNEKGGAAIMYSQGGQPQQISNDGIDFKFSQLRRPDDSFGFLYKVDGHIFYQITFRTDNLTYVFDFNTGKFFTLTDQKLNHHIAKRITFFNGHYYFVSFTDGYLYQMGSQFLDYDGQEIPRIRKCNNFRLPDGDNFICQNINLTMEQGIGKTIQRVDLSLSKDGGVSWGNVGSMQLNRYGNRKNTFNEWNLGMANDLVLQFRFWGRERFVVTNGMMSVYQ